jgi:hypothetical protein
LATSPKKANADTFTTWLTPLQKSEWVVYAKPPFGGPEAVLAYLSRYTHRVAISNSRLISADAETVVFRWKNYRIKTGDRQNTMRLATDEFIRRFLIHTLPPLGRLLRNRLPGNGRLPPHPALRPAGQRDPQGQSCEDPHLDRGGSREARRSARRRDHPAHVTRALPGLRRANAHH